MPIGTGTKLRKIPTLPAFCARICSAPSEIQPWLQAVTDVAAEGGKQLLVVSHHPESINYLAADAAFRMWRDPTGGHSRIAPLVPDLDAGETAYDVVKLGGSDDAADRPASDHE